MNQPCSRTLALAAAVAFSAACASGDDFAPPSWRGGPNSVETVFNWPTPPANIDAMPGQLIAAIPGDPVYTLTSGAVNCSNAQGEWAWDANNSNPGLRGISVYNFLRFDFPYWSKGQPGYQDWERLRIQMTFDGQTPYFEPIIGDAYIESSVTIDPHHAFLDIYWRLGIPMTSEGFVLQAEQGTIFREIRTDTMILPAPAASVIFGLLAVPRRRPRSAT